MIGIILKELRENLKWGTLIFAVVSLFVCWTVRGANPILMYVLPGSTTLILAPLAGLLVGVAQTLFETRPDNWAFVVHRPVSRRAIFVGKCAAGLVLIYAALGLPCLLAAAWAARPGNLPIPFQARMMMPMTVDIANAGCFYFAAMVVTLRKANWFGTRLLVLGLALINTGVVLVMISPFWQALLLIFIVQCIGALAAWGGFNSAGDEIEGKIPRLALGAMIYAGAIGIGFILAQIPGAFATTTSWQQYTMDRDGNLLHVVWTIKDDQRSTLISDIADHPVPAFEGIDPDDPAYADRFVQFTSLLLDRHSDPWPNPTVDNYRSETGGVLHLQFVAPANTRMPVLCYFDMLERIIELYDPVTHAKVGTVGPAGFRPAHADPEQRFPDIPLNPNRQGRSHALAFPTIVYWMELDQHRVRPIYQTADSDPIFSVDELGSRTKPLVIIAQRSGLHILRPSGEVVSAIPIEMDPARNWFQAAMLPQNAHLVLRVGLLPERVGIDNLYLEYAPDGTILHKTQLPELREPDSAKTQQTALLGCVYPLGALPLYKAWIMDSMFGQRTRYDPRLFRGCMIGSAIFSMIVTLVLGRRYRFSVVKLLAWSAANLLLGPAGIVVLLGLNEWPCREICAACGARRLAKIHECSECGAPLPAPAQDGREIFEPVDAFQPAIGFPDGHVPSYNRL